MGELLAQGKNNLDAWWIAVSTFAVLTMQRSAQRVRTGAVRAGKGVVQPASPNLWFVDVANSGKRCLVAGQPVRLREPRHPDPPPERTRMPRVVCCADAKLTLARVRSIFTSGMTGFPPAADARPSATIPRPPPRRSTTGSSGSARTGSPR